MGKFDITAAFQAAVGAAGNVSKSDTFQGAIFALFSAGFVSCAPRLRAGDG